MSTMDLSNDSLPVAPVPRQIHSNSRVPRYTWCCSWDAPTSHNIPSLPHSSTVTVRLMSDPRTTLVQQADGLSLPLQPEQIPVRLGRALNAGLCPTCTCTWPMAQHSSARLYSQDSWEASEWADGEPAHREPEAPLETPPPSPPPGPPGASELAPSSHHVRKS